MLIYCGTVVTPEGRERRVTYTIEPTRPINASYYLCNNRFHVEPLKQLLQQDDKFGFIIMDGRETLFATLCGSEKKILHHLFVDLPKKHGRGGQSSVRFARLRDEKRRNK